MELDQDGDLVVQRRRPQSVDQIADAVLSEVHVECTANEGGSQITEFNYDDRGVLAIEHSLATPLELVGLQVWRGSMLLGDYLMHSRDQFLGCTAIELGAGPGVAGLLAAQFARLVFMTDVGLSTLQNCQANLARNAPQLSRGMAAARVRELDWTDPPNWLAYNTSLLPRLVPSSPLPAAEAAEHPPCSSPAQHDSPAPPSQSQPGAPCGGSGSQGAQQAARHPGCHPLSRGQPRADPLAGPFSWQPADLAELAQLQYILAADVIYDNDLTEAFMRTAVQLMWWVRRATGGQRCPTLLIALERRITFTLRDLDATAPAYDYWRTLFEHVGCTPAAVGSAVMDPAGWNQGEGPGPAAAPACGPGCAQEPPQPKPGLPLAGRRLDVRGIPQYLREYERSEEYMELWELWLCEQ